MRFQFVSVSAMTPALLFSFLQEVTGLDSEKREEDADPDILFCFSPQAVWPNKPPGKHACPSRVAGHAALDGFFFPLVAGPKRSLSLKLSDARVDEPQIRSRIGTTAHFCKGSILALGFILAPSLGLKGLRFNF